MRFLTWLLTTAIALATAAWLIDGADEIDPAWVRGRKRIGVTAGASAPDVLVQGVLDRLRDAATVILLDRDAEGGPAVLMGMRGAAAAFMPSKSTPRVSASK